LVRNSDFIFVEDFDDIGDPVFGEQVAAPYFKTIFKDIAGRSHSPKKSNSSPLFVDNVGFFEYAKLPGIICDRFFNTFERDKENGFIYENQFVVGMLRVFHISLLDKMKLTFNM
jgi:hypothetical protein